MGARILTGLMALALLAGCASVGGELPVGVLSPAASSPFLREIAVDEPIGHWRLEKVERKIPGAIVGEPLDRGAMLNGAEHLSMALPVSPTGASLTVEAWVWEARGTLLSYSTEAHLRALKIEVGERLAVTVLGERVEFPIATASAVGRWRHLAVGWSGVDGGLWVALDGLIVGRGTAARGRRLPSGGRLVVGQAQGCAGGCFADGLVGGVDELAWCDQRLSPSRALSHYLVGLGERPSSVPEIPYEGQRGLTSLPDGAVVALDVDQEGRLALVSAQGGRVVLWNLETGQRMRLFGAEGASSLPARFSPEGRTALTISGGTLSIWDLATGSVWWRANAGPNPTAWGVSADGRRAAVGDASGALRQIQIGAQVRASTSMHQHEGAVVALAYSPDGARLLSAGADGRVFILDAESGARQVELEGISGAARRVRWGPEGERVAVWRAGGRLTIHDTQTGARRFELSLEDDEGVDPALLDLDGRDLVAVTQAARVVRWSIDGGVPTLDVRRGNNDVISAAALARQDRLLVFKRWRPSWLSAKTAELLPDPHPPASRAILAVDWGRGDNKVSIIRDGREAEALTFDPLTGALLGRRAVEGGEGARFAFGGHGQAVLNASASGFISLQDVTEGREKLTFERRLLASPKATRIEPAGSGQGRDAQGPRAPRRVASGVGAEIVIWDLDDGSLIRTISGHGGDVTALLWAPSGRLISGGAGGQVRVHDAQNGGFIRSFESHEGAVRGLELGASGRVVTAGAAGSVKVHDLDSGRVLHRFEGPPIASMRLDPGGRFALVNLEGGRPGRLWDVVRGQEVEDFRAESDEFAAAAGVGDAPSGASPAGRALSPDGRRALSFNGAQDLLLLDAASGETIWSVDGRARLFGGEAASRPSAAFSPDGRSIFVRTGRSVTQLDPQSGRVLKQVELDGRVTGMAAVFDPTGRMMAANRWDGAITLWDLHRGARPRRLGARRGVVEAVAFDPRGRVVASAGQDPAIQLHDVASGRLVRTLKGHGITVTALTFDPMGRWLLSRDITGRHILWSLDTGALVELARGGLDEGAEAVFSADGCAAATSFRNAVRVWRLRPDCSVPSPQGGGVHSWATSPLSAPVIGMAFTEDGRHLLVEDAAGTRTVQDVAWMREASSYQRGHRARLTAVALSKDGGRAATLDEQGRAVLWDATTGAQIKALAGLGPSARAALAFSPDGLRLMAASRAALHMWEIPSGRFVPAMAQAPALVESLRFTDDGSRFMIADARGGFSVWALGHRAVERVLDQPTAPGTVIATGGAHLQLLTGDAEGHVQLWNIHQRGKPSLIERRASASITALSLSPDGRMAVVGDALGALRLWHLPSRSAYDWATEEGQWLYLSPKGVFNASEEGARLGVILAGLSTVELDQLSLTHQRPRLIAEALGETDPDLLRRLDEPLARRRAATGLDLAPPSLGIDPPHARPLDVTILDKERALVEIELHSARGLAGFSVHAEGAPPSFIPTSGNRVVTSITVPLPRPLQALELVAIDVQGQRSGRLRIPIEASP